MPLSAFEIEMKIWNIWSTHPTHDSLTQSLAERFSCGNICKGELEAAYKIFSTIIESAPDWASRGGR